METILFSNARLKVKQADQHTLSLNEKLVEFLQTDFYSFVVERDENSGKTGLRFVLNPSFSEEAGLIIGDTVHNLRSALDNLWWELVDRCGGTCDENTYFPIAKSLERLERVIKDRKIEAIGMDFAELLREKFKSYKGGNDALYGLHELNNIDKHRLLIPTYAGVEFRGVTGNIGVAKFKNSGVTLGQDAVMNFAEITEQYEFKHSGVPTLFIVFGEGQPFQFEPIIPTLENLSILVQSIIQDIEIAYRVRT